MKTVFYLLFFVLSCLTFYGFQRESEAYYWFKGEKIPLTVDESKYYILFNRKPNTTGLLSNTKINKLSTTQSLIRRDSVVLKERWWAIVADKNRNSLPQEEIDYQAPSFKGSSGTALSLSHLFYVKLNKPEDRGMLDKLARDNRVTVIGNNKFMPLWYTISCDKNSRGNALTMANLFYESKLFQAAQPDLMEDNLTHCATDPLFSSQWGLQNTGQSGGTFGQDIDICRAWDITQGCTTITVAVIDHGIDLSHPDMPNLSAISFDTQNGTSPSIIRGNHGTNVAGIIGAAENSIGITGVAPNVELMSISNDLIIGVNSTFEIADGINFAWTNGADVISNSYGHAAYFSQVIDDAISNAVILGRGGLGCVVVYSAGNANGTLTYPSFNSNVMAVGAMSMCGQRKTSASCDGENWGSNYGTGLDVIAPGVEIYTTDLQGSAGENTSSGTGGNYYDSFNGTSAAAPFVSGIAALILSINPSLTQLQARQFIESSADKLAYTYTLAAGENTSLT